MSIPFLEIIVTAILKAAFGEAASRLVRMVLRGLPGASDEAVLRLVAETLNRHESRFDHFDLRFAQLEYALLKKVPEKKMLIVRALGPPPSRELTERDFRIQIEGENGFRRVYYKSAVVNRNALRGSTSGSLTPLVGTELRLEQGIGGVYCRVGTNTSTIKIKIDGRVVRNSEVNLLPEGHYALLIGDIHVKMSIDRTS